TFLCGIEPEMMWMKKTDDPNDAVGLTKPWCYHINQFEELREIILDVVDYGERLGINPTYGDHEDSPGQLELNFLYDRPGRIPDHYRGLCGITASTVNSYKRFWDFGFWAPIYKDYGWQNRTTLVRVASGGRFEFRAVDSACNPYLTQAVLLKTGLDGVKRKLDPGPPQQRNVYDVLAEGGEIPRVPAHLREALEALEED